MRAGGTVEGLLTRMSLAVTLTILGVLVYFFGAHASHAYVDRDYKTFLEAIGLGASTLFLLYGNVLYQFCRLTYYNRKDAHTAVARRVVERFHDGDAPSLTILIPSYREEPEVVWQTLMSAALTEYPAKAIVLLLDDPPSAGVLEDGAKLDATRWIPVALARAFDLMCARYRDELLSFERRPTVDVHREALRLAGLYHDAARWFDEMADQFLNRRDLSALSHSDLFFLEEILLAPARRHEAIARTLREPIAAGAPPDRQYFEHHYRRLVGLFDVRFSSFERKRYDNLSHEANKAMNLNAYISLMGKAWVEAECDGARVLREAAASDRDALVVPKPDYLITLDADSMLQSDYALRLVHDMEQPGHARVGVIQTPYSAFPGSGVPLERLAGATTDLQYIVHQGFTGWRATFWVGANALIRVRALEDIKRMRRERGHEIPVYIQDHTVIEDTESSIDLIEKGWTLANYPERLAHSATPPDFGALLIQRRRWSNGGLLIVPKLLRYAAAAPKDAALLKELFMRFHYLASLAGGTAAMFLMFFYPFDDRFATIWIPLAALPYFVLYARDLRINGYRAADVMRVYALNLALMPVIAGGVLKSLHQGFTGVKSAFGRTPKVVSRSAAPPLYAFLELALPISFFAMGGWDLWTARWSHAVFSMANGACLGYAVVSLLGVRHLAADVALLWLAPQNPAEIPPAQKAIASSGRRTRREAEADAVGVGTD